MDIFRGVEFIFVKERKFIKVSLNTFKIMKFLHENSIGMKVKCMQSKRTSIEIGKGTNGYVLYWDSPGLKTPGVLFKLSINEMDELMRSDILEKAASWSTAYWQMCDNTVN